MASYRKRGKTWQYTISYTDKDTGEYKQVSKGGFRTKNEAITEAQELEVLYRKGIVEDKNITLEEYYDKWINLYKKQAITPRSYQKYKDTLSAIKKYFPDKKLAEIKKSEYQKFINEYAETHAKDSTKRLNYHIKRAVETAIEDKILVGDFT
ncbi:Arm DNA-binding domain-containing protein, partial [Enterococcus faecalis]|nr:Arm DNA-binding domain-containing protein [Enterococcus faecalis]